MPRQQQLKKNYNPHASQHLLDEGFCTCTATFVCACNSGDVCRKQVAQAGWGPAGSSGGPCCCCCCIAASGRALQVAGNNARVGYPSSSQVALEQGITAPADTGDGSGWSGGGSGSAQPHACERSPQIQHRRQACIILQDCLRAQSIARAALAMLRTVLAASQPQRALPLLRPQWARLPLVPARRGLSSPPAPGGGGSGGSGGDRSGPRGLRLFSVPGGWRMARKSEEELEAEAAAGNASGGQRFPFKVCEPPGCPLRWLVVRCWAALQMCLQGLLCLLTHPGPTAAPALPTQPLQSALPQDEFEVARGLVLNREQVVEALGPLMTADRIARIEQARAGKGLPARWADPLPARACSWGACLAVVRPCTPPRSGTRRIAACSHVAQSVAVLN